MNGICLLSRYLLLSSITCASIGWRWTRISLSFFHYLILYLLNVVGKAWSRRQRGVTGG